MPFPRFIKVIINHFLTQHKSLSNLKYQHYHTIKDDGLISRLKFVRIGEDYQEYGLPIPDMTRGKGSQGKKTVDTPVADVDVSEESDSEPARKRTASRRVVKKKVTISTADNIILDPDVLELGKSISLTEAAKEEAARQVHATHARIMTESEPEPVKKKTGSLSTRGVVIQDMPKQEAAYTMQALKESKKTNRRQPSTGGSNEGTGVSPGVPDESIIIPTTSSEGTGTKPGVLDEEKVTSKEKVIFKWGSEQESEYSEEDQDDKDTDDEFVQSDEQVNDDEDEEMTNAEVEDSIKGDAEISDVAKADVEKIEGIKDDAKKAELPPISSSLSVSLGFGDQFLKLSYDTFLVGIVKDTTDVLTLIPKTPLVAPATTLLPLSYVSTIPLVPHQTTTLIPTPPITTDAPTITTVVPESNALSVVQLRVAKIEKDVSKLKKIDHSAKALATLKSQVPMVVK
ncbi:hypothetical protein Tco_1224772 [Tanacetum coccineum]